MKDFITRKIMGSDVETNNFHRMICEFSQIFNSISINKREDIENEIIMCIENLRIMEQNYNGFCKLEESTSDINGKQVEKGISKLSDVTYDDPSFVLKKYFEDFMIRAQLALRHRNKICMIIFNDDRFEEGDYRRNKLNELLNQKKKLLGINLFNYYESMMKEDKEWLTTLTQTRDKIEHVENERIKITDFQVKIENDAVVIHAPVYVEHQKRCDVFMNNLFTNLYLHLEDFISMLINLTSDGFWIINPCRDDDDNKNAIAKWYSINLGNRIYRIDLQNDLKERFLKSIENK